MIDALVPAPVRSCPQRQVVGVAGSASELPVSLTGLTWTISQSCKSSNTQRNSKIDLALKFGTSSFPKEPKVKQLFCPYTNVQ